MSTRHSSWGYRKSYHSIPEYYNKKEDMLQWCREQFGDKFYFYAWEFRFRFKKDLILFLLRWS